MSVRYHEGKFPPQDIDWKRIAAPLERATVAVARYDSFLGVIPDASILASPMLVQEAVASSRIEGTHATVSDVLMFEAGGGDFSPAQHDDVLEVANYRRALARADEMMREMPICGRILRSAHEILLKDVRGGFKSPGRYRVDQNWIGTSDQIEEAKYVPIAPDHLQDGMARWERFVNESEDPALVKVSIAHAEFESLHPFLDGNGRIGRMLVPLMMHADGVIAHPCFYLSEFFEHRNAEYQERLRAVSSDDAWTDWIVFFLGAIESQARVNDEKAHQIYDLYKMMLREVMGQTKAEGAGRAVDCLFRSAIFPASVFVKEAGMSETASRRLIGNLKKSGRLIEMRPHKGSMPAILAFPELLKVTEGLTIRRPPEAADK